MTTVEEPTAPTAGAPPHTGSPATRRLGVAAAIAVALLLFFGLVISGPELTQREAVRLFYLHVPSIMVAYLAFFITLVGSVIYLRTRSEFWDLLAAASAEIGVLFCTFPPGLRSPLGQAHLGRLLAVGTPADSHGCAVCDVHRLSGDPPYGTAA